MNVRERIEHRRKGGKDYYKLKAENYARIFVRMNGSDDVKLSLTEWGLDGDGEYYWFDRDALEDLRDFATFLITKLDGEDTDAIDWRPIAA